MGFLDFFKSNTKKIKVKEVHYAPTYDNSTPIDYNRYSSSEFCDLILQAIHCKQNEFQKIKPRHITVRDGEEITDYTSNIAKILKYPNPYMTWADFVSKIVFLREINNNCYIYPEYYLTNGGKKVYTGLYPLKPSQVKYQIDKNDDYFIEFTFNNGFSTIFPVNDIIHWRKNFDGNDYFGGNSASESDLVNSINNYDALCQTISKAMSCSCQINGIMKLNTYLDDDKTETKRLEFQEKLKNNESGILFTDLKAEYTPLSRDIKLIDKDTLDFFYENILRHTGTPKEILSGKFSKADKESWYERCLEADLASLAQAMEKVLFTDRETSFGNRIILSSSPIQFMSMENKIAFASIAMPSGSITKDEFREIFGMSPLPEGQGKVISQGYNNLLDVNNNNLTQNGGINNNE